LNYMRSQVFFFFFIFGVRRLMPRMHSSLPLIMQHHRCYCCRNVCTPWWWRSCTEWVHTSLKMLLKWRALLSPCLVLLLFGIHDVILSKLDRKFLDVRRRFWRFSLHYKEQVRVFLLKNDFLILFEDKLIIVFLTEYYPGDQIDKNEMAGGRDM